MIDDQELIPEETGHQLHEAFKDMSRFELDQMQKEIDTYLEKEHNQVRRARLYLMRNYITGIKFMGRVPLTAENFKLYLSLKLEHFLKSERGIDAINETMRSADINDQCKMVFDELSIFIEEEDNP